MLLHLSQWLISINANFSVLNYLSLRTILSSLTALVLSFILYPILIKFLRHHQISQTIRKSGPASHLKKEGTPTMGGVGILLIIVMSSLLCTDLSNVYIQVVLVTIIAFGLIGFIDDYLKVYCHNTKGLPGRYKYLLQSLFALLVIFWLVFGIMNHEEIVLLVPVFKNIAFPLGVLGFVIFSYFIIVGASNGANLTDGLDGLAILPIAVIAAALGGLAYVTGHIHFAEYLYIPYIEGVSELVVFCGAVVGAGIGFLWFNSYPALVFMGDVGALALGAVLGVIAIIIRQEIVFFIMSGVFVAETLSVILQVGSYKLFGKRMFRMAPLHHHFELKGWPEARIITRFWIVTFILVLLALASLKIR